MLFDSFEKIISLYSTCENIDNYLFLIKTNHFGEKSLVLQRKWILQNEAFKMNEETKVCLEELGIPLKYIYSCTAQLLLLANRKWIKELLHGGEFILLFPPKLQINTMFVFVCPSCWSFTVSLYSHGISNFLGNKTKMLLPWILCLIRKNCYINLQNRFVRKNINGCI